MEGYFKQNKGITLIVLVATIVGAIIAAGATGAAIVSFNNKVSTKNNVTNTLAAEEEEKINLIIDESEDSNNNEDNTKQTNSNEKIESETILTTPLTESSKSSTETNTYNGYNVIGRIEIPKTKVNYPILEKVTKASLEVSVGVLYGSGPNQKGNTVIVGHNYKNGQFFSNNKMLTSGDIIYITDSTGNRLTYTIYDKFEIKPEDISFYTRDTNGAREITLSTATDEGNNRLVIFAKANDDEN